MQSTFLSVASPDGALLACEIIGSGPPLLLVHGTGADRSRWQSVAPILGQHFSLYCLDRRGRGASGDGPVYDICREYEDIQAVAAAIPGPLDILGHSFGAALLLGAACQIPNLRRMVIYEPPMLSQQHSPQREGSILRMQNALEKGEREAVVSILMSEILGVPLAGLERMRGMPAWIASAAAAHTFPRELCASAAYGQRLESLRSLYTPSLFLLGGESPDYFRSTTELLRTYLRGSRLALLPGQQHSAMLTAPALFAAEVRAFLR